MQKLRVELLFQKKTMDVSSRFLMGFFSRCEEIHVLKHTGYNTVQDLSNKFINLSKFIFYKKIK
jgi:hypothetical protein